MKDGTYIVRVDDDGIPRLSEPIAMSRGYWVSTEGVSVHGKLDKDGITEAMELMEVHDGSIVGVWENEGISYIDKSVHISDMPRALAVAEACGQLAIWDCDKARAIDL